MKTLLLFVSFIVLCNCANILYLSNVPSPSHFIWCKSILHSLHERGHNITALSGDVEKSKENMTFLHLEEMYPLLYNGSKEIDFLEYGKMSPLELLKLYGDLSETACKGSLKSKGYQRLLDYPDDFKVDLVIYDFTMGPCVLGFVHKFKNPPIVGVTPFFSPARSILTSGSLVYPAFVPGHDLLYPVKMNFVQRFTSTIIHIIELMVSKFYMIPTVDKIMRESHPNAPYLEDIERSIKLYLINTQPISDYKLPFFSNFRLVGGAQIKKPKPLPTGLKESADAAKNGLVLFSLGTNVRSDKLGEDKILRIIRALGRLDKYTFFWKFETKEKLPIALPKNVIIQPWMPQNDVLAHNNTKLFISHCGLLSQQEALWYGVPVLAFPIFADQPQNAFRLNELGISETLSIYDFTEEELYQTIKKMLQDPKYAKKIKMISAALRDQPMTPIEEAIYWTEWIIRHPDIDLKSPAVDMNILIRHSLDVFAVVFLIFLVILYLKLKIVKFLIRKCSSPKKVLADKKKKIN